MTMTPEQYEQAAQDSYENCGTDGFLSQWAYGINAQLKRAQECLDSNNGMDDFLGLFHRESGKRIKAKKVSVYNRYKFCNEPKWLIFDTNNTPLHWIPVYYGEGMNSKRTKLWKMGLEQRWDDNNVSFIWRPSKEVWKKLNEHDYKDTSKMHQIIFDNDYAGLRQVMLIDDYYEDIENNEDNQNDN